jgi:autotransporter passenger strand-loop-strand repeat protein
MAQVYEFIVSSGEVFSGLTAGDGQPNATIYVLPGGEIINTVIFSSGWDVLSANTVAIGTTVMSGGIEYVYGAVSSDAQVSGKQANIGGLTIDTQVLGGEEGVGYSGQAIGTTIVSGVQLVYSGGSRHSHRHWRQRPGGDDRGRRNDRRDGWRRRR